MIFVNDVLLLTELVAERPTNSKFLRMTSYKFSTIFKCGLFASHGAISDQSTLSTCHENKFGEF